ncbi:MAG: SdrD B-like domain-containing protein [Planctomycetota bacterium]
MLASFAWVGTNSVDWSDAGNWNVVDAVGDAGADGVPDNDDTLIFDDSTPGVTNPITNNDLAGLTGMTIQFNDNFADPNFEILGNLIDLTPGVAVLQTGNSQSTNIRANLSTNGSTFQVDVEDGFLIVSGTITGTGGITKTGPGRLELGSSGDTLANNFTGGTTIAAGTVFDQFADDVLPDAGNVDINAGARMTLFDEETVGDVNVDGRLDLNTLLTTDDFTLGDGSLLNDIDINAPGITPGIDYDQVVVTGTVTIGDATLQIDGNHVPVVGDEYIIISNDGVDPVIVNAGAPANGSTFFTFNEVDLQIVYDGGDGNDVVLRPATFEVIGYAFEDLDADGIADPGESRFNGVGFFNDINNNGLLDPGEPTTTSGPVDLNNDGNIDPATEDGIYIFESLQGETIFVRQQPFTPFAQTTMDAGGIDLSQFDGLPVEIAPGLVLGPNDPRVVVTTNQDLAVGNAFEGAIYGLKFEDLDGDGVQDPGEPGIPGVTFEISGTDGQGNTVQPSTVMTDADGQFVFANLLPSVNGDGPGTGYTVTEMVPAGFLPTTPTTFTTDLRSRQAFVYTGGDVVVDIGQTPINDIDGLVFGNTVLGSIHLFKYEDVDGNGLFDQAVDQPLENVEFIVQTRLSDGRNITFFEFTDASGRIDLEGLVPSVAGEGLATGYTITETPRDGFTTSAPITLDLQSRDEFVFETGAANLPAGDPRVEVLTPELSIANFAPASIHGLKFEDLNANGVFEQADEPRFANVTFTLTGTDGMGNAVAAATMVTDAMGEFSFDGLAPGLYTLTEAVPAGFANRTPTTRRFTIESGDALVWEIDAAELPAGDPREEVLRDTADANGLIFGNTPAGSIHGFKFEDMDGNGVFDGSDTPLDGVTFVLTGLDVQGNTVQELAVTDVDGQFHFENLLPSDALGYTVTETLPPGFVATTGNLSRTYDVVAGEELVYADGVSNFVPGVQTEINLGDELVFGNTVNGSIHLFKFEDLNGNGVYEPLEGEMPQANVPFQIQADHRNNGVIDLIFTNNTDASGELNLTDLVPGTYTITELPPFGFVGTTGPLSRTFIVNSRQELVWRDGAANIPDTLPPAIDQSFDGQSNLTVGVGNGFPIAQTFTAGSTGSLVSVVLQSGSLIDVDVTVEIQSVDASGAPSGTVLATATTLSTDAGDITFDFLTPPNLIAGEVYAIVVNASSWFVQANSGNLYAGGSRFVSSDGGVTWQETIGDLIFSTTMQSVDPRVEVLNDPDMNGLDDQLVFGNTAPGSIHGLKFEDLNANGVFEQAEPRLAGVTFTLTGTDGMGNPVAAATMVTDAMGEFSFVDLAPGTYTLTQTVPGGFANSTPTTQTLTIESGDALVWQTGAADLPVGDPREEMLASMQIGATLGEELIFGSYVPGSIHGFKFVDTNGNGVQDGAELPQESVEFTLTGTDGLGNPIGPTSVVTDAVGQFDFENLVPGNYQVTETVPAGYVSSTPPIVRDFTITSGQELVWQTGAAGIPPQEDPQPDAAFTANSNTFASAFATNFSSQTFRPISTGVLTEVSIEVDAAMAGEITMSVQTVNGLGEPSGSQLGGVTLPAGTDGADQDLTFDFSGAPINVTAGVQYALVLQSPGTSIVEFVGWDSTTGGNLYADGQRLSSGDSGATWASFPDFDLTFSTMVQPAADPREEFLLDTADANGLIFGNTPAGSIHGFKFEDMDGNRVFDGSDTPLAGVTFVLTGLDVQGNTVQELAVTDANGQFHLENLLPSDVNGYTVTETLPPGFVATTGDLSRTYDVVAGVELVYADGVSNFVQGVQTENNIGDQLVFGNTVNGSIHLFKFEDTNGNGVYEPLEGEMPQANVPFRIQADHRNNGDINLIFTNNTDASGELNLTDLVPGTYTITELPPFGFVGTTGPLSRTFIVNSGDELVYAPNVAGIPPQGPAVPDAAFTGDATGSFLAVQNLVAAQTFRPLSTGGLTEVSILAIVDGGVDEITLSVQTVNGLGEPSGNELGSVTLPAGTMPGTQTLTFDFSGTPINVVGGLPYALVLASPQSALRNRVQWSGTFSTDDYADGVSLASVDGGVTWTPFSNSDRTFAVMVQPAANPREEVLRDTADENGLIFGNTAPGSIHGFKFQDINGNGILDGADSPLAGIEFSLEGVPNSGGAVALQTFTDADGDFDFTDLLPGSYTVTETGPDGFEPTTLTATTFEILSGNEFVWQTGASDIDPLNADDPRAEVLASTVAGSNFGQALMFGNVVLGSIHGFKFLDADADGIFDPGTEQGLENIPFQLTGTDSRGQAIDITVMTGADGEFDFVNLFPSIAGEPSAIDGTLQTGYTVTELVPPQFPETTPITFTTDITSGQEVVAIAGQSTPRFGVPVDDVVQGDENGRRTSNDVVVQGQTFTPTATGPLSQISISAARNSFFGAGTVTMSLHAINGSGDPDSTPLATSQLPLSDVSTGLADTLLFSFIDEPILNAGTSYAFLITVDDVDGISLENSSLNPYAGGNGFSMAAGVVTQDTESDLVFTTQMRQRVNFEEVGGESLVVGNTVNGSIHGLKYEDIDGNGTYDASIDTPLEGVIFTLTGTLSDGTMVSLQTTSDATGAFEFTNLTPSVSGNGAATGYTLSEQFTQGFVSTQGLTSFFNLQAGEEYVWADGASGIDLNDPNEPRFEVLSPGLLTFGNTAPGSIHGFKFEDLDGDGVYEPNDGELPQANVEFSISGINGSGQEVSGVTPSVVTDANGEFWFESLFPSIAGQPSAIAGVVQTGYIVTEVVPEGFVPTTLPIQRTFDLQSRQELVWAEGAAMLSNAPFQVMDQSLSVPDGSGPGTLAASVGIVAIQTFTPALSGTLTNVQIPITTSAVVSSDVVVTIHTVNSVGEPTETVLATSTIAAANVPIGDNQLADFAFDLPLASGLQYAWAINSQTPAGETVSVLSINGNPYAGGNAFQTNPGFLPGNNLPETDISFSTTMLLAADPRVEILIDDDQSGFNEDLMWGNTLPGAIHGFKFNDLNGNGIVDPANVNIPAESRLAGFTIQLRDAQGNSVIDATGTVIPDQVTDANGEYWFQNLMPGTYFVREVQQPGYIQTTQDPQPLVITRGQIYVAQAGQGMLDLDDPRAEIIDNHLAFGNQLRGEVIWRKETKTGLLGGVIFTLTQTHQFDLATSTLTPILDRPITVADNLSPDVDGVLGQFQVIDLPLGRYELTETVPVPGYDPDPTVVTFNLFPDPATDLQDRFQESPHVFFNTWSKRAFRGSVVAARLALEAELALRNPVTFPTAATATVTTNRSNANTNGTSANTTAASAATTTEQEPSAASAFSTTATNETETAVPLTRAVATSSSSITATEPAEPLATEPVPAAERAHESSPTNTPTPTPEPASQSVDAEAVSVLSAAAEPIDSNLRQNPNNPLDVDDSGTVTSLDILLGVNELNAKSPTGRSPSGESISTALNITRRLFLDVNGDGLLSAFDVLLIINHLSEPLRSATASRTPSGEATTVSLATSAASENSIDLTSNATPLEMSTDAALQRTVAWNVAASHVVSTVEADARFSDATSSIDQTLGLLSSDEGRINR